jgi:hypothetical protein
MKLGSCAAGLSFVPFRQLPNPGEAPVHHSNRESITVGRDGHSEST